MKINPLGNIIKALRTRIPVTQKSNKPHFCEIVWQNAYEHGTVRENSAVRNVQAHGLLNTFNHLLINGSQDGRNAMHEANFLLKGHTPHEIIAQTDCEFKELAPLKENLTVYRCIGEKPDFFTEYKKFIKAKNVKVGEKIYMPEYAYATQDINYAKVYLPNDSGILYEIEIPAGSKVSRIGYGKNDEIAFPRSSNFEVLSTETVNNYQHIKLRYLPRTNLYPKQCNINLDA